MTKVFLSYSSKDSGVAGTLVKLLKKHDFTVFAYEEGDLGEFVATIAEELERADRFIALLSRHYQQSRWCMTEWNTAYRLSTASETNRPVITVCEVGEFDEPLQAFLGNYARQDLRTPVEEKLSALLSTLGIGPEIVDVGMFRNREEELRSLLDALKLTSGQDLWVVAAPPRMGKSWFLQKVKQRLTDDSWGETRLLDLARHPQLWSAPADIVVKLLSVDLEPDGDSLTEDEIATIASAVSKRQNHQLYLLDSAERLERETVKEVRAALTEVYAHLSERLLRKRFSVIIGTRQPEPWKGLGRYRQCRFRTLNLSEFKLDVIEEAVGDGVDAEDSLIRKAAVLLQRESDGLPALLSAWLDWAHTRNLIGIEQGARSSRTFEDVTAKYVKKDLLTHDVLFPSGVKNAPAAKKALDDTLKALAPYRLITQSHLKFQYDGNDELRSSVASAGWNMEDLWGALNKTSLLEPRNSLWRVISPPIRRVLYRYYYRTHVVQLAAHQQAKQCYQRWTVNEAGTEQVEMMKECLWHELCQQLLQPSPVRQALPEAAGRLAREFLNSTHYTPGEFVAGVQNLLIEDDEFQLALQDHDGLFQEVLTAIDTAVSEGT